LHYALTDFDEKVSTDYKGTFSCRMPVVITILTILDLVMKNCLSFSNNIYCCTLVWTSILCC